MNRRVTLLLLGAALLPGLAGAVDLVVLDGNPLEGAPADLQRIEVLQTVVGGETGTGTRVSTTGGLQASWPDPIGFVAFAVVVGAVGALPLALALIGLYRRRVLAWMAKTSGAGQAPPERSRGATPPEPSFEIIDPAAELSLPPEAARLAAGAQRRTHRLALVYGLAVTAHAAIASWIYLNPLEEGFYLRRTLAVLLVLSWPLVPTVAVVAISSRRLKWLGPIAFLVAALVVGGADSGKVLIFWLMVMAVPTLLALLVAAPGLRGVAPFAFSIVAAVTAGVSLALFITGWLLFDLGWTDPTIWYPLRLLLGALGAALGLVPLIWAARRYRRKRTSDQALLIDSWWFFLTGWLCITTAGTIGARSLLFLLAFAAYKMVLWIGLRASSGAAPPARKLLLLRVFRRRKESTRLLRRLEMYWRQLGSIQMIMAPDLAVATLEPHDVLDFLSFKLGRKFVASEADLDARLAATDDAPDPDGRFRVNEIFCRADTWQMALRRLVEGSPTVMDLRGFGSNNAGCRFELGTLLDVVPTRRFVLIGDDDPTFLRNTLVELWADLSPSSPNRDPSSAPIRILRDDPKSEVPVDRLLSLLCAASVAEA